MIAPVEPAMARPQGGTSVLDRAAIVVLLLLLVLVYCFIFLSFSTKLVGFVGTRAEGCWVIFFWECDCLSCWWSGFRL